MRILRPALMVTVSLVLSLAASGTRWLHAQTPKVTAGEVVDRETLKGFVEYAVSFANSLTDINEATRFLQEWRQEGSDWNVGNTYLMILTLEGQVYVHGKDPNLDGTNVFEVADDNGTRVVRQMLATAAAGGGFVDWCWDDPQDPADPHCKPSYVLPYTSNLAGIDFVMVGGYYQDLSDAGQPLPPIPLPPLSAADVVDRETLKQFVHGALDWTVELIGEIGFGRVNEWKAVLREDGGHFRSGPIYLFAFTTEGVVFFHGADPWREGRQVLDNTDFQGRPFVREVIATAQAGGGFVEYFWDDPTVQGDEDTGTPKVSYAVSFKSDLPVYQGIEFIVGAGSTGTSRPPRRRWRRRTGSTGSAGPWRARPWR